MKTTTDKDLLLDALDAFRRATGLAVETVLPGLDEPLGAETKIRIKWDGFEREFTVEVKPRLTQPMAGMVAEKIAAYGYRRILVTRYVNPKLADRLREMDIPFMDTAGNAFIKEAPLVVFIKGVKPEPGQIRPEPATRAFRPKGLQIIFAFLCNPGLENQPFRKIAENANVALGTVNLALTDLKHKGFLLDMGKRGRKLVRKERLLKRWVEAYAEDLRPKLHRFRYAAEGRDWWGEAEIKDLGALWGGEAAADTLTGNLKPDIATIYTKEPLGKLVLKHRLRKDPNGNLEVLHKFWNFDFDWKFPHLAPPLLIYADLMATGDTRNIETARMVYAQHLTGFVRED
ncbi:MAG: hypothetical protein JEZ11_09760 [Desulfobacterales bacterium]|nr:hypothetical protein [Desulfobacterales bacterium]